MHTSRLAKSFTHASALCVSSLGLKLNVRFSQHAFRKKALKKNILIIGERDKFVLEPGSSEALQNLISYTLTILSPKRNSVV
jgi:hypothetical protein